MGPDARAGRRLPSPQDTVNRRGFLQRSAFLGVATALSALGVACGEDRRPVSPGTKPAPTVTAVPKNNDTGVAWGASYPSTIKPESKPANYVIELPPPVGVRRDISDAHDLTDIDFIYRDYPHGTDFSSVAGKLDHISLGIAKRGNPAGSLTVSLRDATGGELFAQKTMNPPDITSNPALLVDFFKEENIQMNPSKLYRIHAESNDSKDNNNCYVWGKQEVTGKATVDTGGFFGAYMGTAGSGLKEVKGKRGMDTYVAVDLRSEIARINTAPLTPVLNDDFSVSVPTGWGDAGTVWGFEVPDGIWTKNKFTFAGDPVKKQKTVLVITIQPISPNAPLDIFQQSTFGKIAEGDKSTVNKFTKPLLIGPNKIPGLITRVGTSNGEYFSVVTKAGAKGYHIYLNAPQILRYEQANRLVEKILPTFTPY